MNCKKLLPHTLWFILIVMLLVGCGGVQTEPPGNVSGRVIYRNLDMSGSPDLMPGVMVVLCRVSNDGLPEGPVVGSSNYGETESICMLQGAPTALTDADGRFTLDGVTPGTYLLLFHLWPDGVGELQWDGVTLTEAPFDEVDRVIPPSEAKDFWERGGPTIALANWSASEGMNLTRGNICSDKFGFCFSVYDERLSPIIEVKSNETVEAELTTYFKPDE